eukprot:TRINITY_DN6988_c0_g1_i1.p1 TRINITY_DN6988_c0_g1~~TRINITY_DN6988_c0_g1_i1.p1  ORF type:complete len:521 (+),score=110.03 TRINITY_DN6988_c0_g1_i1:157-1719(+)
MSDRQVPTPPPRHTKPNIPLSPSNSSNALSQSPSKFASPPSKPPPPLPAKPLDLHSLIQLEDSLNELDVEGVHSSRSSSSSSYATPSPSTSSSSYSSSSSRHAGHFGPISETDSGFVELDFDEVAELEAANPAQQGPNGLRGSNRPTSINYVSNNRTLRASAPDASSPNTSAHRRTSSVDEKKSLGSLVEQKTGPCSSCSTPILYTPATNKKVLAQCYNCSCITTFPAENEEESEGGEEEATADGKKKNSFNKTMRGAFRTMQKHGAAMKAKAATASATFVTAAKENASIVAARTKVAAQKASESTKAMAQKAQTALKSSDKENSNEEPASPARPPPQPLPVQEPPRETAIFHVPLAEAVTKSATINPNIPDILTQCNGYIREFGMKEEGIFRLSGSMRSVQDLREAVDRGEQVDLSVILDQHVVSGLYKLYFRELPEVIMTHRGSVELQRAIQEESGSLSPSRIRSVIQNIPTANREVLSQLMILLNEISCYSNVNKMTVSNLAIVFSATLGTSDVFLR